MMNRREAMKTAGLAMIGVLGGSNLLAANPIEMDFDSLEPDTQENCDTRNSRVWHSAEMSDWKFFNLYPAPYQIYTYEKTGIADVREDAFIKVAILTPVPIKWSERIIRKFYPVGDKEICLTHVYGKMKVSQVKTIFIGSDYDSYKRKITYRHYVEGFLPDTKFKKITIEREGRSVSQFIEK